MTLRCCRCVHGVGNTKRAERCEYSTNSYDCCTRAWGTTRLYRVFGSVVNRVPYEGRIPPSAP